MTAAERRWFEPLVWALERLGPFWFVALPLALGAFLISWLAPAKGTGCGRTALWAMTLGSLTVAGMMVLFLGSLLGGDE